MKIIVNKCYGGFGFSQVAAKRLNELGVEIDMSYEFSHHLNHFNGPDSLDRTDPILVAVVEELGSEVASGRLAKLKVVEIPDDVEWEIDEHDGWEWIAEKHQVWD